MRFEEKERPSLVTTDWSATAAQLSAEGSTADAKTAIDQYLVRADPRDVSRTLLNAALRGNADDQRLLQLIAEAVDEPDLRLVGRLSDAVQRAFKPTK